MVRTVQEMDSRPSSKSTPTFSTALTINGGTGNVSIGDEQVPVKGTVTLT